MTEDKNAHCNLSVSMKISNRDRLRTLIADAGLPSPNALMQAVAAVMTVEEAKAIHERAVAAGAIRRGTPAAERSLRNALAQLTPEQLRAALAAAKTED